MQQSAQQRCMSVELQIMADMIDEAKLGCMTISWRQHAPGNAAP
jgi:hypothetical protein